MHSVHTLREASSACTTVKGSIMQLLLPFAEWDSTSEVRHSELFRLRCSELLTDSLVALYNSFA